MITEDYVSFETAKLLKEKKFEPPHDYKKCIPIMYTDNGEIMWGVWSDDWYPRITLQMAMKWLRQVYNIHIRLINSTDGEYRYELYYNHIYCFCPKYYYESYEAAAEAAIKYCLEKLI